MGTKVQVNLVDRSAERTALAIPVITANGANMSTIDAFLSDLLSYMDDLTLLKISSSSVNRVDRTAYTLPTDVNAVRELAVRFVMEDAGANQATFSLGGPNLAVFPFTPGEGGDVYAWPQGGENATLVSFIGDVEVIARHPITGNAMTVKRLELIGRSN